MGEPRSIGSLKCVSCAVGEPGWKMNILITVDNKSSEMVFDKWNFTIESPFILALLAVCSRSPVK